MAARKCCSPTAPGGWRPQVQARQRDRSARATPPGIPQAPPLRLRRRHTTRATSTKLKQLPAWVAAGKMATQTTARSIDRAVSLSLDLAGAKLGAFGNAYREDAILQDRLDLLRLQLSVPIVRSNPPL